MLMWSCLCSTAKHGTGSHWGLGENHCITVNIQRENSKNRGCAEFQKLRYISAYAHFSIQKCILLLSPNGEVKGDQIYFPAMRRRKSRFDEEAKRKEDDADDHEKIHTTLHVGTIYFYIYLHNSKDVY